MPDNTVMPIVRVAVLAAGHSADGAGRLTEMALPAEIPLREIIREIWLFVLVLLGALLTMILFPEIVLWLPRLMGYRG